MGCHWNCRGLSCSSPLATPKSWPRSPNASDWRLAILPILCQSCPDPVKSATSNKKKHVPRLHFHRCILVTTNSRGNKRDKLKGTNGARFAAFRRFSLILADFHFSWGSTALGNCRFSQKTAGNRRFSQKPQMSHLVWPLYPKNLCRLFLKKWPREAKNNLKICKNSLTRLFLCLF